MIKRTYFDGGDDYQQKINDRAQSDAERCETQPGNPDGVTRLVLSKFVVCR